MDINPYSIRLTSDADSGYRSESFYGIQGVVPKWNEPLVWTNPLTTRHTLRDEYISLMDVWWRFNHNHHAQISYKKPGETESVNLSAVELLSEATVAHVKDYADDLVIVCVDNLLPEMQQTLLLRELGAKGLPSRELLWRPIALALAHLSSFESIPYDEEDKIIIVDTDAYIPEITVLTLKEHEKQVLVPLRDYPRINREHGDQPHSGYSVHNIIQNLMKEKFAQTGFSAEDVLSGSATQALFRYLDTGEDSDIWIRNGLDHQRLIPTRKWQELMALCEVSGESFTSFRNEVDKSAKKNGASAVLWNGIINRLHTEELSGYIQMPADSIAVGASIYGKKRIAREPTYLDTLPGLEILSLEKKTGSHKFFPVIPRGVFEGGQTVRIPDTITKFSLEEQIPDFTAVLHNITDDTFKELKTTLPEIEYEGNVPLLLSAIMQPAQGHAKITIEGRGEYEDVFGSQKKIELDWESMKDIPNPIEDVFVYTGPDYYPVRGRIADDPDSLSIAREFATGQYHVGSQFNYPCGRVGYLRIHEQWGYKNPCGHIIREPQRALFGAMKEKDPEVERLAKAIGKIISNTVKNRGDRHRWLNYMFRYAPEKFRDELRSLYKLKKPDLHVNSVYAVGRTFYKRADFELFLDFFLKISEKVGYPEYPTDRYTPAYFWSFFRALCYYKKTSRVDREKVEGVLECICNYAAHCKKNGWPGGQRSNVIKYLLFGILFSLRLREHNHDFLAKGSALYKCVVKVITKRTPQIPYPPAMMAEQLPGRLNDYVLRFVNDVQTKKDIKALQGLVVE